MYVWYFVLIAVVEDRVQHVDVRLGFDCYASSHAKVMDILDHLFRVRLLVGLDLGRFGSSRVYCGFIVKAV